MVDDLKDTLGDVIVLQTLDDVSPHSETNNKTYN